MSAATATIEQLASEPTCDASGLKPAEVLLHELQSSDTPTDRMYEIIFALVRLNPDAYVQLAKVHLRGIVDPINERPESKRVG